MAFATAMQADVLRELEGEYGVADLHRIEYTEAPYGVMWVRWLNDDRNLFIKPDGTRLSWEPVQGV